MNAVSAGAQTSAIKRKILWIARHGRKGAGSGWSAWDQRIFVMSKLLGVEMSEVTVFLIGLANCALGVAMGSGFEWVHHRKLCDCERCKRWRADQRKKAEDIAAGGARP